VKSDSQVDSISPIAVYAPNDLRAEEAKVLVNKLLSRLEHSLGVALLVGASAVAPMALTGCQFKLPAPYGEGTGTPLTEYSEPIAGPSLEGPAAILRAAVQPVPERIARDMRRVRLGRRLFHDPILSGDGTVSCASCHSLDRGGADGRVSSLGIRNQVGPINSPTVLNARFHIAQFWDGRAADLREQAAGPVANPAEMGATWDNVVAALNRSTVYPDQFRAIYPDGVTAVNVRDAIASYEEMLVTPSRFDRWLRGDERALSAEERAGADLFVTTGCITCHQGVALGGTSFQKMGSVRNYFNDRSTPLTEADNGRFNHTHVEADRYFFKVPTLRNVALTAPYLHDGSRTTLEETVRVMGRYQLGRELTGEQVTRLVAFLNALTGELPADARLPEGELPPPPAPAPLVGAVGVAVRPAGVVARPTAAAPVR
jgi:cytochrome c peroxidase